ncbi:adenylyl-sulfate kinase [Vibrio cholerae]|uniref:adenylyl-sulfate kinase n=1 Tax=Vibrio cholerae TaxID=666 RepID=UPI0001BAD4AE|nr:adenylyl-sulfate kinase [Vibrio cholerae]EEY50143.1 adenylylsulfate kinase [Vibrio cholerae CT 5369-93]MEB5557644.1 adenylyl-sulfate kinase [Vibrio cholerae]BCN22027.1 putative adenylyl-sulfate kinase [Vibrio cholerae]GIB62644.1 adenylyl-sulfate kinase [Vibrio cholerae]HBC3477467.1 adenylyl-sulfate kinase [Vibrio cholerae]
MTDSMNQRDIVWHLSTITPEQRQALKGQSPFVLWFTGLSGSGKSTLANAVEHHLFQLAKHTYLLDGDNLRCGLNRDLGFSEADRAENLRRVGEVCKLFVDSGTIVLGAFISPFQAERQAVRELFSERQFIEVYVNTPLAVCEQRDPKGLYKKARAGEIRHFTGIDATYQPPQNPDIVVDTSQRDLAQSSQYVIDQLISLNYLTACQTLSR